VASACGFTKLGQMTKCILHTYIPSNGWFFFLTNFVVFWQKNWESFGKFCFPRVNWTTVAKFLEAFTKFLISKI